MNVFQAILLGIIQGVAEWMPISSSGHLALADHIFNITSSPLFNLSLHLGSILALLIIFRIEIKKLLTSFFTKDVEYKELALLIIIATAITGVIAFLLQKNFLSFFDNLFVIATGFFITGVLLFLTKFVKETKEKVHAADAVLIGAVQGIALLPGISRSGSTIAVALFRNVNRVQAVRFSFLLVIPAVLGAFILEFNKNTATEPLGILILGTIISFIVSFFMINYLLDILKKGKIHYFAYYCFALAVLTMFIAIR